MTMTTDALVEKSALLMDGKGVSELTGIPLPTIYELTAKEQMPHLRLGRRIWYPRAEILAWISAQTNGPRDAA